jgi:hypothetical protein
MHQTLVVGERGLHSAALFGEEQDDVTAECQFVVLA